MFLSYFGSMLLHDGLRELMQQQPFEIVTDNAVRPAISVTETTHADIPPLSSYKRRGQMNRRGRNRSKSVQSQDYEYFSRWDACIYSAKVSSRLVVPPAAPEYIPSALTTWSCANTAPLKVPKRQSSIVEESLGEKPHFILEETIMWWMRNPTSRIQNRHSFGLINDTKTDSLRKPRRKTSIEFVSTTSERPHTLAMLDKALELLIPRGNDSLSLADWQC